MSQENPPLGKAFVLAFDQDNKDYPIIAVPKDPRDKTIPTIGTTTGLEPEWVTRYPNNKFTVVHVNPGQPSQRVLWMYERLPGPLLSGQQTDNSTGIKVNFTKQRVLSGTVTGGVRGAGVVSLSILNAGSGFSAGTYSLGFSGGGGTGAAGTYTVTAPSPSGKIGSVALGSAGAGFTSLPTASISGGGGSGAMVSVTLLGKPIASLTLISSDTTFTDVPPVVITDSAGTGVGALGTATLTATTIGSIVADSPGTGYATPTVFIGPPDVSGGTQAVATAIVAAGAVTGFNITNAGTGYRTRPVVTVTEMGGSGCVAHAELSMTTVASVALNSTGNLYQNPIATATIGGSSASLAIAIQPTSISTLTLTAAGSGYTAPTMTISGGGGSGATGTAALATGTITSVILTLAGSNYTTNPTVTTPSGGGSGASISAVIGDQTYVNVTPQSSVVDLVDTVTVDRTTIPSAKRYPVSVRVQRSDYNLASLIILEANAQLAVGLNEVNLHGGSGPVEGYMEIQYLTESQYEAFDPDAFSISGEFISTTMNYLWADPSPHVFTARITPVSQGTTSGILDLTADQMQYGIWKIRIVGVLQNF